jgi:hypothetical protein
MGVLTGVVQLEQCEWGSASEVSYGILLEYDFSCLTGQQEAFYPKNKWITKSVIKRKKAKTIYDLINPTFLSKEVLLPDWARWDMRGTKGGHVPTIYYSVTFLVLVLKLS